MKAQRFVSSGPGEFYDGNRLRLDVSELVKHFDHKRASPIVDLRPKVNHL